MSVQILNKVYTGLYLYFIDASWFEISEGKHVLLTQVILHFVRFL